MSVIFCDYKEANSKTGFKITFNSDKFLEGYQI
jgi:hypothetical protein